MTTVPAMCSPHATCATGHVPAMLLATNWPHSEHTTSHELTKLPATCHLCYRLCADHFTGHAAAMCWPRANHLTGHAWPWCANHMAPALLTTVPATCRPRAACRTGHVLIMLLATWQPPYWPRAAYTSHYWPHSNHLNLFLFTRVNISMFWELEQREVPYLDLAS